MVFSLKTNVLHCITLNQPNFVFQCRRISFFNLKYKFCILDETHMLDGFKIYISTGPSNWKNGTPCYKDTTPGYPSSISNVTCVGYGRYVTISNDHYHEGEAAILELCEVQVFGMFDNFKTNFSPFINSTCT